MASKPVNTGLPAGFESPFKRVQMEERMDDSLACVATLTNRSMQDIKKMAFEMGLPQHGPYYVGEDNGAKLLGAITNDTFRFLASGQRHLQVFEQAFTTLNAPSAPLFCITFVIDGDVKA